MAINDTLCRENLFKKLENVSYIYEYNKTFPEPYVFKYLTNYDYLRIAMYIIVIFGGLVGNISIILIVLFIKSTRTTINFYIANLAVADALICLFCMVPHVINTMTFPTFALGEFMCKFNPYTQTCCLTCSVLTLSAISCDRFVAIMFPLRVRITKQRPSIVMTLIWIISLTVSIPNLIVKKHIVLKYTNFDDAICMDHWPLDSYWDNEEGECADYEVYKKPFYLSFSIIIYFIPIVVMMGAYSLILRKLWNIEAPGEQHAQTVNLQEIARKKIIKLVFVVLLAFILCWTPLQTFLFISTVKNPEWLEEFRWYSHFLAYSNSFINPIIYGFLNKAFRDNYLLLLKCRPSGRPGRSRRTFTTGTFTSRLSRFTSRFILNSSRRSDNAVTH